VTIVMGLDQHRAQITAEWLDTSTGELSRTRIAPADRAGVRAFALLLVSGRLRSRWRRGYLRSRLPPPGFNLLSRSGLRLGKL